MTYVGYAALGLFAIIAISAIIDMIWTVVDSARESRPSRMRLVLFVRDLRSAVRKARTERELDELIERHSLASEEFDLHYAHDALALADRAGRDERRREAAVAWARRVATEDERGREAHEAARGVKKARGAKSLGLGVDRRQGDRGSRALGMTDDVQGDPAPVADNRAGQSLAKSIHQFQLPADQRAALDSARRRVERAESVLASARAAHHRRAVEETMADARAERHRAVLDALEGRWDEPTAVSTVADAAGLDSATVELMDPAFPTRCWCVWLRCSQAIVEAHRDELADPERGWQVESLLYAHTPEDAATEARRSWAHQLDTDPGNFEVLSVSETRYLPPWE